MKFKRGRGLQIDGVVGDVATTRCCDGAFQLIAVNTTAAPVCTTDVAQLMCFSVLFNDLYLLYLLDCHPFITSPSYSFQFLFMKMKNDSFLYHLVDQIHS